MNKYVLYRDKVQYYLIKLTTEILVWAEDTQVKNHSGGSQIAS